MITQEVAQTTTIDYGELLLQDMFGDDAALFADFLDQPDAPVVGIEPVEPNQADVHAVVEGAEALLREAAPEISDPVVNAKEVVEEVKANETSGQELVELSDKWSVRESVRMVGKRIGLLAVGSIVSCSLLFGVTAVSETSRPTIAAAAPNKPNTNPSVASGRTIPTVVESPVVAATSNAEVATTTPIPVYRPGVGEQSAVLKFGSDMCYEEMAVREVPAEFIETQNTSVVDSLELDPTPQWGCAEGTAHAEQMRANGQPRYSTREDPRRFKVGKGTLPRLPDGSRPTNYGQLQPIVERSQGSSMFGEPGVVYIDGHRSTQSAPFNLLDNNKAGGLIVADRGDGKTFLYKTVGTIQLDAKTYHDDLVNAIEKVKQDTGADSLMVLSACGPYGSDTQRIVTISALQ